jgi:glyoxylate/hydroxypyruvate reductase
MVSGKNETPTVLVCAPILGSDLSRVRAFEPAVRVVDGNEAFTAVQRAQQGSDTEALASAQEKLNALLAEADVICMSFPMLKDVAASAPNLRWFHHTQAGVSNLWSCDVWQAEGVVLTSGRGHVRPTAMAEYTIAGALAFARGLHDGYLDKPKQRMDRRHYKPIRIEGATMGVVGLGGIGKEVARLSQALGMRVLATRRSVTSRQEDVDYADLLLPASELSQMAAESDFLAVCTQLTQETFHLVGRDILGSIKQSAVVINISRGEVIDEEALLEALDSGRVQGALLDVYEGEMDGKPPRPELMAAPNVILTPHISNGGAAPGNEIMDLFCENLRRFVEGEELLNVVDRARGY